jgi:Protein of unknown function (DUF2490)
MKRFFLLLIFIASFQLNAQNLNLKGFSPNYYQTGNIFKNFGYNLNVSSINSFSETVDNKEFTSGQLHFVAQLMLIQKFNKHLTAGVGYGYGNHNIFGLKEIENRYLGQVGYLHNLGKIVLNHRLRFEYRKPLNIKTDVIDDASILRYQTYVTLPLYNPKETKKGFYLSASNEMFWYLQGAENGPVSAKNGVFEISNCSEDWLHVAGGYNLGKARVELGYCYQTLIRNKKLEIRNLNLLQLNVYVNLNWNDLQSWWYL